MKGCADVWVTFDEENIPIDVDRRKPDALPEGYRVQRYTPRKREIYLLPLKKAKGKGAKLHDHPQ